MKITKGGLTSQRGTLILVAAILLILFALAIRQVQSQEGFPIGPPTPVLNTITTNNTATPDIRNVGKATIYPTFTPFVISKELDLSPDLSDEEEYFILVQKGSGEIIFYKVGPAPTNAESLPIIPELILDKIPLEEEDIIISWEPPSLMRRQVPESSDQQPLPTVTPTTNPYP